MNDLVSFLMPVFNRSNIVLETLLSIQKQTHQNWECIIVDDGSTDKTVETISNFIESDKRFKLYNRPSNLLKGANSCRNYALSKSKGKFIQLFDSDDLLSEDFLKLKTEKFLKYPDCDAVLCGFKCFEEKKWVTNKKWSFEKKENLFKQYLLKEKVLNSVVFMWKLSFFKKLYFNEKLTRAQDLDSIFKVLNSHEFNFEIINEDLIYIRLHENSITGNFTKGKLKDIDSEVLVRENILENHIFNKDLIVKKKLSFFYLNAIKKYLINNYYLKFFKVLIKSKEIKVNIKFKLFFIGLIYFFFKKGLTAYTNIIKA